LTVAEGVGVNGAKWHRKQDRVGLAFVSNGIKKDHQIYLADGGYGFLIGDGKPELWAREHSGNVLHRARVAGN